VTLLDPFRRVVLNQVVRIAPSPDGRARLIEQGKKAEVSIHKVTTRAEGLALKQLLGILGCHTLEKSNARKP
jgi:hypothetical protein